MIITFIVLFLHQPLEILCVCDRRSRYQNQKYLELYQKYFEFYEKYLELLSHHCVENATEEWWLVVV